MLHLVRKYLVQIIDDIDSGNSNATEDELLKAAKVLNRLMRKDVQVSKYQAYTYLGISRATFDNMVKEGKIPKGKKVAGFKELMWDKRDIINIAKNK